MHLSLGLYFKDAVKLQKYNAGYYLTMEVRDVKGKQLVCGSCSAVARLPLEHMLVLS